MRKRGGRRKKGSGEDDGENVEGSDCALVVVGERLRRGRKRIKIYK